MPTAIFIHPIFKHTNSVALSFPRLAGSMRNAKPKNSAPRIHWMASEKKLSHRMSLSLSLSLSLSSECLQILPRELLHQHLENSTLPSPGGAYDYVTVTKKGEL